MSSRRPDRRRETPGGSPRRGGAARAFATTRELLVNIARVILLAIMLGAVIQAVAILVEQPASLGSPTVNSYVACALAVVCAVLMLALALNSSYLPDRLFAPRRLGLLFAVVSVSGAAAIVVGLLGSLRLGTVVAIDLLLAAVPFVLMGLISPGLFRRPEHKPLEADSEADADADGGRRSAAGERERGRQRRGGRSRR